MDNKTTILKGVCEMGKYIGIDLGTTFSCMAYINEEGQPVVIPNGEGKNTTPSTVLFDGTSTIVGEEAKNQSIIDPQNFEQFVKRHMGERDYLFSTEDGEKIFARSYISNYSCKNEGRCRAASRGTNRGRCYYSTGIF